MFFTAFTRQFVNQNCLVGYVQLSNRVGKCRRRRRASRRVKPAYKPHTMSSARYAPRFVHPARARIRSAAKKRKSPTPRRPTVHPRGKIKCAEEAAAGKKVRVLSSRASGRKKEGMRCKRLSAQPGEGRYRTKVGRNSFQAAVLR